MENLIDLTIASPYPTSTLEIDDNGDNIIIVQTTDNQGNRQWYYPDYNWHGDIENIYEYHIAGYSGTVYIRIENDHNQDIGGNFFLIELNGWDVSGGHLYRYKVANATLYIKPFIFNRIQADVNRVKELNQKLLSGEITYEEQVEWEGQYDVVWQVATGMKGALNQYDLMRIEYNMTYLSDKLNLSLDTCYNKSTEQFTIPSILYSSYFQKLRNNLLAIYNTGQHYPTTPQVPELPFNKYQQINDIEEILYDTYIHAQTDVEALTFCGESYAFNTDDSESPGYTPDGDALPVSII